MTEIKETLVIIKGRWPEVILLVGIGFFTRVFLGISKVHQSYRLWIYFSIVLLIVDAFIYLGFLRTAHLEGSKRQSVTNLLQKGKSFFWRFCCLLFFYMVVLYLLMQIIFWSMKTVIPIDESFKEASLIIKRLCFFSATLIMLKLYLLIPSIIIVFNCRVLESLKFLNRCRLLKAKELLTVYFIQMTTSFVWMFLSTNKEITMMTKTILGLSYYIIWNLLTLMILVLAIRFIVSLDLDYADIGLLQKCD